MMSGAEVAMTTAFAAAMVGTPGPANMLLFAGGLNAGVRRTLPFLAGTIVGFQFVSVAAAAGLAGALAAQPRLYLALKAASVAYIVYLAVLVARARPRIGAAERSSVPGFARGLAVHPLNPKAYAMSIAGYVTFAGNGPDYAARAAIVFAVFVAVSLPLNGAWVVAGQMVDRAVADEGILRWVNRSLAVVMVGVVAWAAAVL